MFATPAYAQAAGGAGGSAMSTLFLMVPLFAIMYFLMIRPQQKRMKQHREMVAALKKGDQVVTQGGLIGKVTSVKDDEIEVEIAQGVRVRAVRPTIAQVISATQPVAANN